MKMQCVEIGGYMQEYGARYHADKQDESRKKHLLNEGPEWHFRRLFYQGRDHEREHGHAEDTIKLPSMICQDFRRQERRENLQRDEDNV